MICHMISKTNVQEKWQKVKQFWTAGSCEKGVTSDFQPVRGQNGPHSLITIYTSLFSLYDSIVFYTFCPFKFIVL